MTAGRLDARAILAALDEMGARVGRPLSVVEVTTSTSDDARAAAAVGAPHGAAFLAEAQTAGRGRGGHRWHSPAGENLYLSMVLRPAVAAAAIAPVTLAIGLAVALVLDARGAGGARIKWPNDVYVGAQKLAGVLVEGQLRGAEVVSLVAGVGVNVGTTEFPPELEGRATSLRLLGAPEVDRSRLAAVLVAAIGAAIDDFERGGLARCLEALRARDALAGQPVRVGEIDGVGAGIDADGRLCVRDGAGWIHRFSSGEVTWTPVAEGPPADPSSGPRGA